MADLVYLVCSIEIDFLCIFMYAYLFFFEIPNLVIHYYILKVDVIYMDFKSAMKSIYIDSYKVQNCKIVLFCSKIQSNFSTTIIETELFSSVGFITALIQV